jgi:hypothetical protein
MRNRFVDSSASMERSRIRRRNDSSRLLKKADFGLLFLVF